MEKFRTTDCSVEAVVDVEVRDDGRKQPKEAAGSSPPSADATLASVDVEEESATLMYGLSGAFFLFRIRI